MRGELRAEGELLSMFKAPAHRFSCQGQSLRPPSSSPEWRLRHPVQSRVFIYRGVGAAPRYIYIYMHMVVAVDKELGAYKSVQFACTDERLTEIAHILPSHNSGAFSMYIGIEYRTYDI